VINSHTVVPIIGNSADLPSPFIGYYESWACDRTGLAHTVLNLFALNADGDPVFVRCIHGLCAADCDAEFADWVMGLYDTELIG
jgi:hypothetical protein